VYRTLLLSSFFLGIFFLTLTPGRLAGQSRIDTIPMTDAEFMQGHNPRKASLYSAVLPGLGQIYNKKWWKVPIIYAGFGVMTYFIYFNTDEYLTYRSAMIESQYGNTNGNYAYLVNKYSLEELTSAAEYYRRNLEISVLITTLWYILNIVDATVDAHLYTYDINDNLSLRISPDLALPGNYSPQIQAGIKLSFNLK